MKKLCDAIAKYISLSDTDISVIEQYFTKREIKNHDYFLKAGEVCKYFAFVEQGLFGHFINNEGQEETIYFSSENDFLCDFESFINKKPSCKTITALEDSVIYVISHENMQHFYTKVQHGERFGRLLIEGIFTKAIKHIVSIHTDDAEVRYLNFLKSYKHIQQRIPQYYIASFVGVTPQSLSRIRRKIMNK